MKIAPTYIFGNRNEFLNAPRQINKAEMVQEYKDGMAIQRKNLRKAK